MNIRKLDEDIAEHNSDLAHGRLLTFRGGKLHWKLEGLQLIMRPVQAGRWQGLSCNYNKRAMTRHFGLYMRKDDISILMIQNGFFTKDAFYEFEMDG